MTAKNILSFQMKALVWSQDILKFTYSGYMIFTGSYTVDNVIIIESN